MDVERVAQLDVRTVGGVTLLLTRAGAAVELAREAAMDWFSLARGGVRWIAKTSSSPAKPSPCGDGCTTLTGVSVAGRRPSCLPAAGASPRARHALLRRGFAAVGIAALVFDYHNLGVSDGANRQHLDPWPQIHDYQSALSYLESLDPTSTPSGGRGGSPTGAATS